MRPLTHGTFALLGMAGACGTVPEVVFNEVDASVSDASSSSSSGGADAAADAGKDAKSSSSSSSSSSSGAIGLCDGGEPACCAGHTCVGCDTNDCNTCKTEGCKASEVCCPGKGAGKVDCSPTVTCK